MAAQMSRGQRVARWKQQQTAREARQWGARSGLTALVAIEDTRHADQVQGHAELGIGHDIQGLLAGQAGGEAGRGVLAAGEAGVGDVEQLGRVGRRRQRIGVAYPGNVVLVDHALAAASRL
jgi:hypothetical protein